MRECQPAHIIQQPSPVSDSESLEWILCPDEEIRPTSLWVSPRCAYNLGCLANQTSATSFTSFSSEDWALCIIKPDAKQLGLEHRIKKLAEKRIPQLERVLTLEDAALTPAILDKIWPAPIDTKSTPHPPTPWWGATVEYMTSAPVDIHLMHGVGASTALLGIKAALRKEFYGEGYQADATLPMSARVTSIIHTSDCDKELVGNALAFWSHQTIREAITNCNRSKR